MIFPSLVYTLNCFFVRTERGIRDGRVTGVQTCALPIWVRRVTEVRTRPFPLHAAAAGPDLRHPPHPRLPGRRERDDRSEERRVGKEWDARWWPDAKRLTVDRIPKIY